ncbi:Hypothetical protein SMAX5B_015117 [Scophthalmus maximus]|uniref:Uncharacterized protein n=1 Tax=Scophthalmus maximus TaxID=52904 RepID=A0A2U9CEE3_SCOMX|nr:Hypothetical protein SMAX5B_015117 [Scophthalmus maximus]
MSNFSFHTMRRTLLHQKLAPGSAAMLDQQVYLVYQCKHDGVLVPLQLAPEDDPGL